MASALVKHIGSTMDEMFDRAIVAINDTRNHENDLKVKFIRHHLISQMKIIQSLLSFMMVQKLDTQFKADLTSNLTASVQHKFTVFKSVLENLSAILKENSYSWSLFGVVYLKNELMVQVNEILSGNNGTNQTTNIIDVLSNTWPHLELLVGS